MKKKIIIGVLIAALIAGGTVGGAVYYRKSHQSEVSVVSVDSLASQYYTDDTSLEGNIATSAVQNVSIDKDMIVQDIYVSKGDTVKKGDKLVSFDMTLVQMELKIAKLKQEQQEQNLAKAQKRLTSLRMEVLLRRAMQIKVHWIQVRHQIRIQKARGMISHLQAVR